MNWRQEKPPKMNKDKQMKNYIKSELKNYYLYLEKVTELMIKKKRFDELSDNPPTGGSLIKMPDGSCGKDGQPHKISINKCDIESNLIYYENKLDILDNWMNILTKSQHDVVKVYVMEYQCKNIHEASITLATNNHTDDYSEDTINKYTNRAIKRIYAKINKII